MSLSTLTPDRQQTAIGTRPGVTDQHQLIAVFWTAIVSVALFLRWPQLTPIPFFAEAFVYLLLLLGVFQLASFRRTWRSASLGQQTLAVLFVGLLLVGQLGGQTWGTFPFVTWDMYTRPERSTNFRYLQYEAIDADGQRSRFNPTHAATSLNENRLVTKLGRLYDEALAEERLTVGNASGLERMLQALAHLANRHTDIPIVALAVYECNFDLDDGPGKEGPNKRLVATYNVASPGSSEATP